MICYVLAMGKQHLGPHVVVGYGIKIFWPGLYITSPDHLEVIKSGNNGPSKSKSWKVLETVLSHLKTTKENNVIMF